jgi:hypothetical protein
VFEDGDEIDCGEDVGLKGKIMGVGKYVAVAFKTIYSDCSTFDIFGRGAAADVKCDRHGCISRG